jgi:hypothetical protein
MFFAADGCDKNTAGSCRPLIIGDRSAKKRAEIKSLIEDRVFLRYSRKKITVTATTSSDRCCYKVAGFRNAG